MTAPSIELQQRVCRARAAELRVPLLTPDSPQIVREAIALAASAVSRRTLAEVRAGTSFYTPRLAGQLWQLLPDIVESPLRAIGVDLRDTGAVYLSAPAWAEHPVAVVTHEFTHHHKDVRVSAGGAVVSALWGLGYGVHDHIRAWEEGTCRVCDLTALVVIEGVPIDAALAAARTGADAYALGDGARALYLAALDSAADSLRAWQLPGVDTEVHHLARMLRREGWDAGPWAEAVGT